LPGAATASDEAASIGSIRAMHAATAYRVDFFTGFSPRKKAWRSLRHDAKAPW
jgi:hypothetical protein